MSDFILLILGWAIYFFTHSFFAATTVKKRFEKHLWVAFRYYRFVYNVFSIVGLVLLLLMNRSIPSERLLASSWITLTSGLLVTAIGIAIIKAAFKQYSMREFLGIGYYNPETFRSTGILQHVRHPLYAGIVFITIGLWLLSPDVTTLLSAACIFMYLPIGIYFEEKKLIALYGDMYIAYRKRVPAIIPGFKN